MLRSETRARARALQLLYAWEMRGEPPVGGVVDGLLQLARGGDEHTDTAERLALAVIQNRDELDTRIQDVLEGWRWERVGTVEKNILRLALEELRHGDAPTKVVIDEALRLAHWFAGQRAHQLINGLLDRLAREHGRL